MMKKEMYLLKYCFTDKPNTAATAGVNNPVPATKEAAIKVDPPVTTSIALTTGCPKKKFPMFERP